jgi:hypothetical protein
MVAERVHRRIVEQDDGDVAVAGDGYGRGQEQGPFMNLAESELVLYR